MSSKPKKQADQVDVTANWGLLLTAGGRLCVLSGDGRLLLTGGIEPGTAAALRRVADACDAHFSDRILG